MTVKASELRNLSVEEIEEKVKTMKRELMQYRFQSKTGKLEQQSLITRLRRDIARALTVRSEKKSEVKA